jgi:hypothetical protein
LIAEFAAAEAEAAVKAAEAAAAAWYDGMNYPLMGG